MEKDLATLFVTGKEVDEGLLVEILAPFLKINQETLSIVPNERWLEIENENKIVLYLIARKAMKLRGLSVEEGASPSEIEQETGVKGNSLRPKLKILLENKKIVNKTAEGKYYVPGYSLAKVKASLDAKDKGE